MKEFALNLLIILAIIGCLPACYIDPDVVAVGPHPTYAYCLKLTVQTMECENMYVWVPEAESYPYGYWHPGHYAARIHHGPVIRDHRFRYFH